MWFRKSFQSRRRSVARRKPSVVKQRRLLVERLEDRRLLTIVITGRFVISGLPCASGAVVPVSGALVSASYGSISDKEWTDSDGDYAISLNATAALNTTVEISFTAQSRRA